MRHLSTRQIATAVMGHPLNQVTELELLNLFVEESAEEHTSADSDEIRRAA